MQGVKLGEGSYGVVRRGTLKMVGNAEVDVAVKQMRSFMVSLVTLVEFHSEVSILRCVAAECGETVQHTGAVMSTRPRL